MASIRPDRLAPVLPAQVPWALHDTTTSRAIEAREQAGRAQGELMQQAGHSVARWTLALAPHARSIWVAVGPGGNGGDGLHAAAELQASGRNVTVTLCAQADRLPDDARAGLQRAAAAGVDITMAIPRHTFDVTIDALLGIGANRAPEGQIASAIHALNGTRVPCLAVDLPSGLGADTGCLLGSDAVRAAATLSLLTIKPGLFTAEGRDHAGSVWFDALGTTLGDDVRPTARLTSPGEAAAWACPRRHAQHKGSFGDVIVVGGAPGMAGAARLAGHGSLGAGAGRTIVSILDPQATAADDTRPEWLWRPGAWLPGRADLEGSTVVCGCGGGDAVREALPALLSRAARLVLDADALNAIAADAALVTLLLGRATRGVATVLTPHPLEAARLLRCSTAAVQADRLHAARSIAQGWGVVVVLKGSGTVIAAPDMVPAINSTGNGALASGGTGDVLAGWIAGEWAQVAPHRTEVSSTEMGYQCAAASAWLHGAAADRRSRYPVRARDLVESMRDVRAGIAAGQRLDLLWAADLRS